MGTGQRPSLTPSQGVSLKRKIAYVSGALMALSLATAGLVYLDQQSESVVAYYEGSFEGALEQAAAEDQLCFVQFSTDFCYPCQSWVEELRGNRDLTQLIANQYLPYRIDPLDVYTGGRKLAIRYHVEILPTLIITDSEGREITRLTGEVDIEDIRAILQEQSALRVPPARPGSRSGEDLVAIMAPEAEHDTTETAGREFGLQVGEYSNFLMARRNAVLKSRVWNKSIWVQNDRQGNYQLVIGRFDSRKEARITARFLKLWESQESKVIRLKSKPLMVQTPRLGPTR